jgi:hypothetical protein
MILNWVAVPVEDKAGSCLRSGQSLPIVGLTMFAFGVGEALPLLAIGLVSPRGIVPIAPPPALSLQLEQTGHGCDTGRDRRNCPPAPSRFPARTKNCGGGTPRAVAPFFVNHLRLYVIGRCEPATAINGRRNKPIGPGGSTRRLHHRVSEVRNRKSDARSLVLVSGFWFLVSGFWFLVSGFWFLISEFR